MTLFQLRGPSILRKLAADQTIGAAGFQVCPDTLSFKLTAPTTPHYDKCGLKDVEDASFDGPQSAEGSLVFATRTDRDRALALLGNISVGDSGSITNEAVPTPAAVGDVHLLGGLKRHRNITALTIGALVADTDFTLDAATGKVTFLTEQSDTSPPLTANYTYDDTTVQKVSMLTSAGAEYALDMEAYNRQASNRKCTISFFRIKPSPADSVDLMGDGPLTFTLPFKCLINNNFPVDDTEFGRFGVMVNLEDPA